MLYDQFTSVKVVIAKVYRDLQLQEEDKIGDMIEWAAEAMDHIGAFGQFRSKNIKLCVDCFRAQLPRDFESLQLVSYNGLPLYKNTDVFGPNHNPKSNIETNSYIVNEASLYSPVFVGNVGDSIYNGRHKHSYSIDGRNIRTSFENGELEINYMSRILDEDNWPMIPNTVEFREAVFRYIVYKLHYGTWIRGEIADKIYEKLEQDWWNKCRGARGSANMPDLETMQNLATSYLSIKPNLKQFDSFFRNLNNY